MWLDYLQPQATLQQCDIRKNQYNFANARNITRK